MSGIMGALDITPALSFVGLGLKNPLMVMSGSSWWTSTLCPLVQPSWSLDASFYCSWTTRRRTLACWLVSITRPCCMAHSSFNCRVPQVSLPWTFLRNELKTQLVQCLTHANPAHRLARQRQFFLNSDPDTSHCADQRHSAKHIIHTHSTLRGTLHRHTQHHWHRQHTFLFQMRPLIRKSARGPFSLAQHLVEKHNLHTRGPT